MFYRLVRPFLFKLSPELAHTLTLPLLQTVERFHAAKILFGKMPLAPRTVMGLHFPNPVGLAAGMDKNGECIEGFSALGFGFIEVGTVTPRPQIGNPQPRLFRIPEARALINRMGFNNHGVDHLINNLKRTRFNGILGVNIGKNADTPIEDAVEDYLLCLQKVYAYSDYVVINVSSPNTPRLRQLQKEEELDYILHRLKQAQSKLAGENQKYVPLVVKIAPDLNTMELTTIADVLLANGIDGVIATNTTISRVGIERFSTADEVGGLSGAPLFKRSTEIVQQLSLRLQNRIPIIASGGIMSPEEAHQKLAAGASLIQLYTGLIYEGPWLVRQIVHSLQQLPSGSIPQEKP